MRSLVQDRLPRFTDLEMSLIKGSYDFIGLNYYTSNYASSIPYPEEPMPQMALDDKYSLFSGMFLFIELHARLN